jgi:hypothetical protein
VVFSAPSRSEMQTIIWRALRDPNGTVFPPDTVNDFIAQALSDLSGYRPKEQVETAVWPLDIYTPPFTDFTAIWKVEVVVVDDPTSTDIRTISIPYADASSETNRAGWDFFGGSLILPAFWSTRINATIGDNDANMVVWGYTDRDQPDDDDSILDLADSTDFLCAVNHCKSQGFELLTHDRALYQQWLAATNNTDVSPTQLTGMYNQAESSYQHSRARNTKMRRMPTSAFVHVY